MMPDWTYKATDTNRSAAPSRNVVPQPGARTRIGKKNDRI